MIQEIITSRLTLREVQDSDVEGIFRLDSDPEVHRYLGNKPISTLEESRAVIAYIRNQYKSNGLGRMAVIEKATGDFIGWAGLKYEDMVKPKEPYYDLGYRLIKQYWGKGYATEASVASLKYGFETLSLEEICGGAAIGNKASNRILSKIGFVMEAPFMFDGEMHNWYVMDRERYNEIYKLT